MVLGPINITVIESGSWGCGSFVEGFLEEGTLKPKPKARVGRSSPAEEGWGEESGPGGMSLAGDLVTL